MMMVSHMKYGALAAKAKAMHARNLKAEDFIMLSSMASEHQIVDTLRQHPAWADSLPVLMRMELRRAPLEENLKTAVFEDYRRLSRFVPRKDRPLYETWFLSVEIEQALGFINTLANHRPEDYRLRLPERLLASVSFDAEKLLASTTYDEMLAAFAKSPLLPVLKQVAPTSERPLDYTAIDLALHAFYFQTVLDRVHGMYKGSTLKKLMANLGEQIDLANLLRALRLRRFIDPEPDALVPYLIPHFQHLKEPFFYSLLEAKNEEQVWALIAKTKYGSIFSRHNYAYAEQYLLEFRFEFFRRAFHAAEPSLLTAFAYLELKQTEVRNLIHVIECVHYRIPKAEIPFYLTGVDRLSFSFMNA